MEIILAIALTLILAAAVLMMAFGIPFRVEVTHHHVLPTPSEYVESKTVESDKEREERERQKVKDIATAINDAFFDRQEADR
jgi:hypothetical protein